MQCVRSLVYSISFVQLNDDTSLGVNTKWPFYFCFRFVFCVCAWLFKERRQSSWFPAIYHPFTRNALHRITLFQFSLKNYRYLNLICLWFAFLHSLCLLVTVFICPSMRTRRFFRCWFSSWARARLRLFITIVRTKVNLILVSAFLLFGLCLPSVSIQDQRLGAGKTPYDRIFYIDFSCIVYIKTDRWRKTYDGALVDSVSSFGCMLFDRFSTCLSQ